MVVFDGSYIFIFVGNHVAVIIINIIIAGNIAIFKAFLVIIGIYEIDTTAKIADALKVTLDFLVKDAEYQNIDNDALKRLKLLEKLSPER